MEIKMKANSAVWGISRRDKIMKKGQKFTIYLFHFYFFRNLINKRGFIGTTLFLPHPLSLIHLEHA